jgi:hypothetical protein
VSALMKLGGGIVGLLDRKQRRKRGTDE